MSFIKFEGTNKREETRITVTGHSSFGFPTRFYKDNAINQFRFVTLFFNQETNEVGFRFHSDEAEPHKFSISKSKQDYGGGVVATSFFKVNDLKPEAYRGKYDYRKENIPDIGELFIIKLEAKQEPKTESASEVSQ